MIDGLVASSLWIVGMYSAALLSVEEVAKHGWQGHTALWWRSICVNYLWLKRTLHGSNSILQPAGAAQQHQRKLSFESIHTHTHTARLVLRECCTKNQGEHRCSFFKSVVLSSNGTESTWVLRETGNVWDKFSDTGFYRMTCDLSLVHMKYDWRRVCRLNISK